jgi:hypothetical protein
MSKRASSEALSRLHAALAEEMRKILQEGVTEVDNSGELVRVTPGAAYFNAIRQFLKDNGIDNPSVGEELNTSSKFQGLPFTQADEFGIHAIRSPPAAESLCLDQSTIAQLLGRLWPPQLNVGPCRPIPSSRTSATSSSSCGST